MRSEIPIEEARKEPHDPTNDFIVDAFVGVLPSAMLCAVRAARAVVLLVLTLLLARNVPAIEADFTLAFCVAILSLFNMTKWMAAAAIGVLLVVAVVPPHILALAAR